jgi:hypothetical protein
MRKMMLLPAVAAVSLAARSAASSPAMARPVLTRRSRLD